MWTLFKVFIEFVTILFLLYVLGFWPGGMWDLNSLIILPKEWLNMEPVHLTSKFLQGSMIPHLC